MSQTAIEIILSARAAFSRVRAREHWDAVRQLPVHRGYGDRNCVFVHIPKTGGLAVSRALFGAESQHRSIYQYRIIFGSAFCRRAFKFAVVRDPLDRFLSAYRFLTTGGINDVDQQLANRHRIGERSADDFASLFLKSPDLQRYIHFSPQSSYVREGGRVGVDFIARFEQLTSDFQTVCDMLQVPGLLLPTHNVSKLKSDAVSISEENGHRIRAYYAKDYELLPLAGRVFSSRS